MRGPTHALVGATTAGLFLVFNVPYHLPFLVLSAVSGFSALFPDMDGSESMIEHVQVGGFEPFSIPAFFINKLFSHRGFLHSLPAVVLLIFILLGFFPGIPKEIDIAIVLGYLSHIVADALTPEGVPWFYPIPWRSSLLPDFLCITTGSFMEKVFFIAVIFLYVGFLSKAGYIQLPAAQSLLPQQVVSPRPTALISPQ